MSNLVSAEATVTVTAVIEYDYSDYYDSETEVDSPCDSGGMVDFCRVFIVILYSLVIKFGFIGNRQIYCLMKDPAHVLLFTCFPSSFKVMSWWCVS